MRALRSIATWAAAAACVIGTPALAHHSFAMFENNKNVDYVGTVKSVEWSNPHVWVEMVVQEGETNKTYGFEGGAVAVLKHFGWNSSTVKVGDKVTLTSHPFKDGRAGGSINYVTLADGRKVSGGNGIPGAVVAGPK
jgi:hypothetical protein